MLVEKCKQECRDGGAVERARLEIVFTPIRVTRVQIPFSAPEKHLFGVLFLFFTAQYGIFGIQIFESVCRVGIGLERSKYRVGLA